MRSFPVRAFGENCGFVVGCWAAAAVGCAPSGETLPTGAGQDSAVDADADTDTDTDADTEPASRAAEYSAYSVENLVTSGSVRSSALVWNGERWVIVYMGVNGTFNVYSATVEPSGGTLVIGAPTRVDDGEYDAFEAEIAADATGRSLAVYEDDRVGQGTCCREIYGRFLYGNGQPAGPSFDITNRPESEEYMPAVANEGGTWFVAWSDDRLYAGDDRRLLYGRPIASDGTLGTEIPLGGDSLWQVFASVSDSRGDGYFLVVWGDYDPVDGSLDCGYRARVLNAAGEAVTDVIDIARIGNQVYDRPGVAWDPWKKAWLVAWMSPYAIHGSWVFPDGTTSDIGTLIAPEVGAGAARLTWAAETNSFVLGWHAWWTYEGFVTPLSADGLPAAAAMSVSAQTPPLGTFYVPVSAGPNGDVLAAPSLDYARITASWYGVAD